MSRAKQNGELNSIPPKLERKSCSLRNSKTSLTRLSSPPSITTQPWSCSSFSSQSPQRWPTSNTCSLRVFATTPNWRMKTIGLKPGAWTSSWTSRRTSGLSNPSSAFSSNSRMKLLTLKKSSTKSFRSKRKLRFPKMKMVTLSLLLRDKSPHSGQVTTSGPSAIRWPVICLRFSWDRKAWTLQSTRWRVLSNTLQALNTRLSPNPLTRSAPKCWANQIPPTSKSSLQKMSEQQLTIC